MEKRRVVVTGMGVLAPNGVGIENFWGSLVHGLSAVRRITRFDASSYPAQIAAEVADFNPIDYMDPKTAKRLSRFAQFALAASEEAKQDAGLDFNSEDPYKIGVVIGTDIGGEEISEIQHAIFMEKGLRRLSPYAFSAMSSHSAAGMIAFQNGLKGTATTIAGSNSGLNAIYVASRIIEYGDAEIIMVGAGEAPITPYVFATFCATGFLSRENQDPQSALKPYDIRADGTVIGEGGAFIIMEEFQHALKRKAKLYGEILGCSSSVGGPAISFEVENFQDTLAATIEQSLMKATLNAKDIDYISGYGNGILQYDVNETLAIKKAFGELAYEIPITSISPVTGHSFSVSGILQLITCLLVINNGVIPPTINHDSPDPRCDLYYVPNHYIKGEVKNALMSAYGFGGNHTTLIVGKLRQFGY